MEPIYDPAVVRYRNDARFHALVHSLVTLMGHADFTQADIEAALGLARRIRNEQIIRRAVHEWAATGYETLDPLDPRD